MLICVFLAFSTIGELVVVFIGMLVDDISANFSVMLFFLLSAVVVAAAWPLAVRATSKADA